MAGSVRGRDGIWTSPYGVGHSLYLTPYLGVGRAAARVVPKLPSVMWEEFVVSFSNVPVIAGLMANLVAAWRRMGATEARMAVGVGLFGLCSMLWPYAKLPFSDSLLALSVFAAWFHWTHGAARTNYHLSIPTMERAMHAAGLENIRCHQPQVSPEGRQQWGESHWLPFLQNTPITFFEATKR